MRDRALYQRSFLGWVDGVREHEFGILIDPVVSPLSFRGVTVPVTTTLRLREGGIGDGQGASKIDKKENLARRGELGPEFNLKTWNEREEGEVITNIATWDSNRGAIIG